MIETEYEVEYCQILPDYGPRFWQELAVFGSIWQESAVFGKNLAVFGRNLKIVGRILTMFWQHVDDIPVEV